MIGSGIAGGLLGTLVLTSIVRAASEMGLTRMDFALILGTMVTTDRRRARAYGYGMHLAIGLALALVYAAIFLLLGRSSVWLGALLGALHTVFLGVVVLNVLLPVVHPLMGTPETAANAHALIEPPGFLMLNYGRSTFVVALVAHIAFGAVVGWAIRP
jgi:hypothetical protein